MNDDVKRSQFHFLNHMKDLKVDNVKINGKTVDNTLEAH
jgi:hypothetical protein